MPALRQLSNCAHISQAGLLEAAKGVSQSQNISQPAAVASDKFRVLRIDYHASMSVLPWRPYSTTSTTDVYHRMQIDMMI